MHRNVKDQLFLSKILLIMLFCQVFISQRYVLLNTTAGIWKNFSILFGDLKRSSVFFLFRFAKYSGDEDTVKLGK